MGMTRAKLWVGTLLLAALAAPLAAQEDAPQPPADRCEICDTIGRILRDNAQEWSRLASEWLQESGNHQRLLDCAQRIYEAIPPEWRERGLRLFMDLYLQLPREWRREIYRVFLENMRNLPPDLRRDLQRELLRALMQGAQNLLPFLR